MSNLIFGIAKANSLFHTVKYKNHSVGYIFHTVEYKSCTVKQRIFQSVLRNILLNFELILPGLQIIRPAFLLLGYILTLNNEGKS